MPRTLPPLDERTIRALASYAVENGPKWKEALSLDWYNARAAPDGILHALRNSHGAEWLDKLRAFRVRVDRKTKRVTELSDLGWEHLTPELRESVLHGDACGHPSNRPKGGQELRWTYHVAPDLSRVVGIGVGAITTSGEMVLR